MNRAVHSGISIKILIATLLAILAFLAVMLASHPAAKSPPDTPAAKADTAQPPAAPTP